MRSEHGGGVPESTTFAQALDEFKREGSTLLVVGETTTEAHAAASRRLMSEAEDPRRRLFVFTTGSDILQDVPSAADADRTKVVSQASGGVTATPDGWPDAIDETAVDDQMLSPLAMATIDAIEEFEEDFGEFEPAELRVCFDSVTQLLRDHQSENVFRMLHLVTTRVRQVNGIGHFHLRMERDTDPVRLLEPMFDAVVEMHLDDGTAQQRWHLRDREVTSEWMSL